MLEKIKKIFTSYELLQGNYGIERESLRVDNEGRVSKKPHPSIFGDKISNQYITTDFSESQVEMITPPLKSPQEVYSFSNALYDITAMELDRDEYLWPQSMPSIVPSDDQIIIAQYDDSEAGKNARKYREKLIKKYGGKKQLICGIHYNFSFEDSFLKKLYKHSVHEISFKEFKNNIYLKIARNYLRYRWLEIYLLGASGIVDESYKCGGYEALSDEISSNSFTNEGAISYRNSECGYKNNIDLYPDYSSTNAYIESVKKFIDDGIIDSHKELYSSIRLKPKNVKDFMKSLDEDGIMYLEYRSIDINPFEKGGISLEDLKFLQIFNLYLLIKEEYDYSKWQEEGVINQDKIATFGQKNVMLKKNGMNISREEWSLEILNEILHINDELDLKLSDVILNMIEKVKDSKLTYAYRLEKLVKDKGYIEANLELGRKYKEEAYKNRFKLEGFEYLELSTQILMKEAIKRGIKVTVLDKSENFIRLQKGEHIEYVKQATKTSKDNYVTVLIMENKSVTKQVLREHNIRVPDGIEVFSMDEAYARAKDYEFKPIVIKPKSTNFGTGISIFSEGTSVENIIKAFEIAFKHDNTVLLEEFIKGKEYRFLVIDNKVAGILHRVPANVKGDGIKTIRELVAIKNEDPLRGYHYVTPLEKINLDENAALFLKNQGKDFEYIPQKDEIVYLRENSNISTGGDSIDYTDDIPQKFKNIAVNASKAVGARICGVDMMLEDYKDKNSKYGIIELNFNPAIHIHCYPYKGKERKIGEEVLKVLGFIK
ncbi:bifunctional glutamate--cysteine ligase GshA/glutathione synthetase GshB [Clostridium sp. SM-530-WT-3G]|uniref:bifunctional glutamate--cysteine ligase GshA/glutathione synthetase GshB n=1 Tax=Clostridium sp. SM-530-WT-3G TaxID=2725303 RepID=UPI00145FA9BA|nr:bifunctional glutamate--cysteine ligase GshA/glutathione synthetase GshB [Clostridium sp. SM-530-WT-3G]NME81818.1 bifunctional glutamate--cysteine ligase GshA/glutathione synthetase GshB [Clostridium sp. SM-530-WT-3G]